MPAPSLCLLEGVFLALRDGVFLLEGVLLDGVFLAPCRGVRGPSLLLVLLREVLEGDDMVSAFQRKKFNSQS